MGKVKILHCGDIHIGAAESFLGEKAEARRFETLITFERIVDIAVSENVKVVVIAGDLFDSNSVESGFVQPVLNKISDTPDVKFLYVAGNHDPLDPRSPFVKNKLPSNLFVFGTKAECKVFEDISLRAYGKSFDTVFLKGEEDFALKPQNDGYVNLMIQHGELKSDLNSQYNAITRGFIEKSKMDYIALGHIHKRTEIGKIGNTCFAYCGCPEGQGFDETDQKGVYIGEIGDGECNLSFVTVAKRMHIVERIDVTGIESTVEIGEKIINTLKEKYGENYGDNLYKIQLTGEINPNVKIIVSEICGRISDRVYFIKIKDLTTPLIDFETLSNEASLKGIFTKKMLRLIEQADEDKKELYQGAMILGLKAFEEEVNYVED